MSDFCEESLLQLMKDYVQQHQLHLRAGDLSTWEEFRQKTRVPYSAEFLHQRYLPLDTSRGVNGDLMEDKHFTWCNDVRDGLQARGIPVTRDVHLIRRMLAPAVDDFSAISLNLPEPDCLSTTSDDSRTAGCSSNKPRSKKRLITNHERYLQIKRNLEKAQKRRRMSSRT